MEKKNAQKIRANKKKKREIDLFIDPSLNKRFNFERDTRYYSQIIMSTTTTSSVAFDSSSRPLCGGSLITAESRREYLSLPSVVRWHQSTSDVEIHVRLPRGASEKKGDVNVNVTSTSIRVRLRGHDWGTKKEPLAGTLFRRIKRDESSWTSVRKRRASHRTNRSPPLFFSLFTRRHAHNRMPTSCISAFERIETSFGNQSLTTMSPTGSFRTRSSRIWSTPTKARRRSRTKSYRWKVNSWWKRCG